MAVNQAGDGMRVGIETEMHTIFDISSRPIGRGGFGDVRVIKCRFTNERFAMKKVYKRESRHHNESIQIEKKSMEVLNHPFIVKLHDVYESDYCVYLIMDYINQGELREWIRRYRRFALPNVVFYSAELISALEYLRTVGIVHKDIKTENILLSESFHIKLTDFGLCEKITDDRGNLIPNLMHGRCGTRLFFAPEVQFEGPMTYSTDLWLLAAVISDMYCGHWIAAKKDNENHRDYYDRIDRGQYDYPMQLPHPRLKDLMSRLLVKDPDRRIGATNMNELKNHRLFCGLSWDDLATSIPPRIQRGVGYENQPRPSDFRPASGHTVSKSMPRVNNPANIPRRIFALPPHVNLPPRAPPPTPQAPAVPAAPAAPVAPAAPAAARPMFSNTSSLLRMLQATTDVSTSTTKTAGPTMGSSTSSLLRMLEASSSTSTTKTRAGPANATPASASTDNTTYMPPRIIPLDHKSSSTTKTRTGPASASTDNTTYMPPRIIPLDHQSSSKTKTPANIQVVVGTRRQQTPTREPPRRTWLRDLTQQQGPPAPTPGANIPVVVGTRRPPSSRIRSQSESPRRAWLREIPPQDIASPSGSESQYQPPVIIPTKPLHSSSSSSSTIRASQTPQSPVDQQAGPSRTLYRLPVVIPLDRLTSSSTDSQMRSSVKRKFDRDHPMDQSPTQQHGDGHHAYSPSQAPTFAIKTKDWDRKRFSKRTKRGSEDHE